MIDIEKAYTMARTLEAYGVKPATARRMMADKLLPRRRYKNINILTEEEIMINKVVEDVFEEGSDNDVNNLEVFVSGVQSCVKRAEFINKECGFVVDELDKIDRFINSED